jgi:hypothetical protein
MSRQINAVAYREFLTQAFGWLNKTCPEQYDPPECYPIGTVDDATLVSTAEWLLDDDGMCPELHVMASDLGIE